jgi:hypothetical protein
LHPDLSSHCPLENRDCSIDLHSKYTICTVHCNTLHHELVSTARQCIRMHRAVNFGDSEA